MKWWGWLVIAIGGSIMWTGLAVILGGLDWIDRDGDVRAAIAGGVILICSGCVVIPLVQKAIKAAKGDK